MKSYRLSTRLVRMSLVATCLLFGAQAAFAQQYLPQTRLFSISPLGGKAGTTIDVRVTSGDDLDELDRLIFNHPGITAAPKTQESGGKQVPIVNAFVVTVAGDVPAGTYEVRAAGLFGLSNPRVFEVGDRDEIAEAENNNTREQAQEIPQNVVVNGAIGGGADVDFFRIDGKKDQRIIVTCRAAQLDSRLTGTLEMRDANGRRVQYSRGDSRDDPFLDVTLPADGQYYVKLHDFLYGGGNDYGYRLIAGTGPYVDFVMPPSGAPGSTANYTLYGRNLPGGQDAGVSLDGRPLQKVDVSISLPERESTLQTSVLLPSSEAAVDGISYIHKSPQGCANPIQIFLASAAVSLEKEPNDEPAQAQQISVPAEIGGQFQARGDSDLFDFAAKAGEVYYVEVYGQRNGGTGDPYLVLDQITKNDQGEESLKRITVQDDNATNLAPNVFDTVTDDPVFRFQVPADSNYRVTLRDRYFEVRGNPNLTYRLAIRHEQPDFRVLALPTPPSQNDNMVAQTWSAALRKGDNVKIDLLAFRQDGFEGAIEVTVEGLPPGVECRGTTIGAKQNNSILVFSAAEDAAEWTGHVKLIAKAKVEDPRTAENVKTAEAAVKAASDALPKLQEAVTKTGDESNKANEALAKATEEAKQKPDDEGLKAKVAEAQKAADAAAAKAKEAADAKAAADKQLADAQGALQKAEQDHQAATREVSRQARVGTIAWNGANNQPGVARVAQSLGLSVLKEKAPYQVTTDVFRVEANQSRQILVPVKLFKRDGFDNNVNLSFAGLDRRANIQVDNKVIQKGKDEELLRIFINNNAAVGTHTLYLRSQGQVAYQRNVEKVERTRKEQAEAAETLKQAQEAAKKATEERDAAKKKSDADAEAMKKAQEALAAATKNAAEADAAKLKAAEAKAAADQGDDANAKEAAAKALTEAEEAAKKAAAELEAAKKAAADAEAAAKAAAEANTKAEAVVKETADKAKAADDAKKAIDNEFKNAENAAKPRNINCFFASTPIIIEVRQGPATLSASVPNGGNLKKGEKLDVKVTVNRVNGFEGPVTLTLPEVHGIQGMSAEAVTIPADQKEGVLSIQAAGDATEGQLQNLVVRGTMDFNGKAAVDVPVTVKVSK